MKRISAFVFSLILLFAFAGSAFSYELPNSDGRNTAFPYVGSACAVLMDAGSGAVIREANSAKQVKPGSLTVMMTALLLIESTAEDEWDEALEPLKKVNSTWSARAAQMGLAEGDAPTKRDLLYGLLLCGAADAAYIAEQTTAGSTQAFVNQMNQRAAELGMTGTSFENSFGLSSGVHYTTAHDMAILARECIKHPIFREAAGTPAYVCSFGARGMELVNSNTSLGMDGCTGLKAGYDSGMDYSLVLLFEQGEVELISVIIEAGSESEAYAFARSLSSEGFAAYIEGAGLTPRTPTALLTSAADDTVVKKGTAEKTLEAGSPVTVCGINGETVCVYFGGEYYWGDASAFTSVFPINDIIIEHGDALTREHAAGEALELDAKVYSRHEIELVSVKITLPDGTAVFTGEYSPRTHGGASLAGTELAESLKSANISGGIYDCLITVTANAKLPDGGEIVLTRESHSMFSIGTGAVCVSYNANGGDGAPAGECYIDSFTVPEETPTRFGYRFVGWNTSPDGTGRTVKPGENVTGLLFPVLYASWQEGEYAWDTQARFMFDGALMIEGFVHNDAGITSVKVKGKGKKDNEFELYSECGANEAALGTLLLSEQVIPEPGDYTVELYASAGGRPEELLMSQELTVGKAQATDEPLPVHTEGPGGGFSLMQVPIAVWFILGAVVVAGLIYAIIRILKNG